MKFLRNKKKSLFKKETFLLAMLDNMPVLLADEDKLSPMEQSTSSTDDR